MQTKKFNNLNLIGSILIVIILSWDPFFKFFLKFNGLLMIKGFLEITVMFLILVLNKRFVKITISKPIVWYAIWAIYVTFSTYYKGREDSFEIIYKYCILPFITLCISTFLVTKNRILFFNSVIIGLYIYIILVFFKDSISDDNRLGDVINSNYIGLHAAVLIFFIITQYFYKVFNLFKSILLLIFPLSILLITGSRTAFGYVAIIFVFIVFIINSININNDRKRIKSIIITSIYIIIMFFIGNKVLKSTLLGERLLTTTTQIETGSSAIMTGTVLDKYGDRGIQYIAAIPLIKKDPIFGIGLMNYMNYSYNKHSFHSEYLIQICECGILGFILYLFFYIWIGKNLFKCWKLNKVDRSITLIYIAGFFALLFISTSTRISPVPLYFCYLGAVIGYLKQNIGYKSNIE